MPKSLFYNDDDSDSENIQLELADQENQLRSNYQHEKIDDNKQERATLVPNTTDEKPKEVTPNEEYDDIPLYPLIPIENSNNARKRPNLDEIRPVDIQLSLSLPFQYEMVQSCISTDDPFMIVGKGLGMSSIVANVLHVLATPVKIEKVLKRSLVIVMNASPNDNQLIGDELQELSWLDTNEDHVKNEENESQSNSDENPYDREYHVVTADSLSVDKRRQLYLNGGIVSVTSRILIVDLLSGILHPSKVTGMVVLNVDTLRDYSNESFIIEIYRSQNQWGFIKGFSEAPESFIREFSPLKTRMNDLKFKNVLLWPRFRVDVSSVLNNDSSNENNNVIEVRVEMSNSMSQIQFGIMGCLKKCIAELNRTNPKLALEWWNIDNVLDVNFLKSIDYVMMPNWHRITFESKQLVKDIRYLKMLLKLLIVGDCVDFYEEVQLSLDANKPSLTRKYSESPWLMAEESQLVISHSRKRLFYNKEYCLEELPKWDQLLSMLDDISHEKLSHSNNGPTLIVCSDKSTVRQLSKIIRISKRKDGFRQYLMRKLEVYKQLREERAKFVNEVKRKEEEPSEQELDVSSAFAKRQINTKRRRTRGAAAVAAVDHLRNSGAGADIEDAIQDADFSNDVENVDDIDNDDLTYLSEDRENEDEEEQDTNKEKKEEQEFFHMLDEVEYEHLQEETWKKRQEQFEFIPSCDQVIVERFTNINDESLLQEIRPSHIIMYEPDLAFIRRVEIYRATYDGSLPKVFFMYYGDSVEEQSHLTAIKREKDAFTKLIKENASLSRHYDTTEDLKHYKNLAERKLKLNKLNRRNTRNAGGQSGFQTYTQDVVIVDTREFNASLPGLLFRYGIRVVPCMLNVGDYIISPDICIERKSVSDLIGSLQNNRLVSQCKKMTQFYRYPTLLIEFDQKQSFSLEPFSERRSFRSQNNSTTPAISSKLSQFEIQLKLTKIVTRFPTLKIIWSSSPLQTVNMILELKFGREQPDPNEASSFGATLRKNTSKKTGTPKPSSELFTNLLKIPGVSNIDYFNIRKKVKNYTKLQKMSTQQIADITADMNLANKISEYLAKEKEELEDLDDSDIEVI
ncbi:DNA repair protein Rad1p [Monosporozyma unispora]